MPNADKEAASMHCPNRPTRPSRSPRLAAVPCAVALLLTVSTASHHAAMAQDAPAASQRVEVIGTTPLGTDGVPLAKTPANVQTLKARDIREQGATNLADLLNDNIGSVSVSNGTGSLYQNDVNYRGFQATSLLGAPVGISVYFDGVRMNEPFGSLVNWDLIPMNAVSRLSLIPGSNPAFGLNTLGGSIVLETKNGRDNPETSVDLTLGSFQRRAVSVESGGSAGGQTDYFVAANVDRQNGYRLHSGSEVQQLFSKVRWRGDGGKTDLQLSLALANNRLNGTQGLPEDMMADRKSAYTWPDKTANTMGLLSLNGSHWLSDRNKLVGNVYYRDADSKVINSNAALDDGCFAADGSPAVLASGAFKCGNKAPGGTAVNSITGANSLALGFGRWTSSINTSLVESTIHQRTGGASLQWLNFGKVLDRDNAFTLGASLDASRVNYTQDTVLARLINYETVAIANREYGFTANGLVPSATNLPTFNGSTLLAQVGLKSTTRNLSLFFTDKLDVTDRLSLSASGSFNLTRIHQTGLNAQYLNSDGGFSWTDPVSGIAYYNPDYSAAYKFSNAGAGVVSTPNGAPAGAVAGPESNSLDGSHRYQRFNPALGFTYNADKSFGVFGGYSEAMRAPTSIELSCADPNNPCSLPTGFNGDPDLKPVIARTFELGGRGELAGNVSWNLAVYDTRLKDDIQFIATSSTFGYFSNVGATERRGVEAGVQARLDKLRLALNFGHVKAQYRTAFTTAAGQDVPAGSTIPGIPSNTVKLRATYQATPDLLIGANLVVASWQYAHGNENNSDPAGVVPGYALAHLDLHYRASQNLSLSARVTNLFDKKYSTYGLAGVTSIYTLATQSFFTPAPPRAVWVGLNYSLGG
jgi:outer membrane receptor protein involved in Fe transport